METPVAGQAVEVPLGAEGDMAALEQAPAARAVGQTVVEVGATEGTSGAPARPPGHEASTGDLVRHYRSWT